MEDYNEMMADDALAILTGFRRKSGLLGAMFSMINELPDFEAKNKQKIEQAVMRYIQASKYPRKKKKAEKKAALIDYNFWIAIDKWWSEDNIFNIRNIL